MFDFSCNGEYTHMPFITYDKLGQAVYFFCKQQYGFWKIFYSMDGVNVHRLETGLPDDAVECSPFAEWEDNTWKISFVAGGSEAERQFYLYKMIGLDGEPKKLEKADFGFYSEPRKVYGLRSNTFIIDDNGTETKYEIPEAEYIYRISYIPEDFNQLLITGQTADDADLFTWIYNLADKSIHAVIADGVPAYKCCFFKRRCFYAQKNDLDGFEDRHVVEASDVQFVKLDKSKIIASEVVKASMACADCLRKHLAGAISYAKEVMNGHGAGASPDHRADLAGELINAEHHAEAIEAELADRIRYIRKTLEKSNWQPEPQTIDYIRNAWNDSFFASGCGCRK